MPQRQRAGRRTDYEWQGGSSMAFAALAAGGTTQQSTIVTVGAFTLMRVRGHWSVSFDGDEMAADHLEVGIGLLLQQTGAVATSLPLTDPNAPWIWYDQVALYTAEGTNADQGFLTSYRGVIDSKAMRRMKPDQSLIFVLETSNIVGAPTVDGYANARFLFGS